MARLTLRRSKEEVERLKVERQEEVATRKAEKEAQQNKVWQCAACLTVISAPTQAKLDFSSHWHVIDFHDDRASFKQKVKDGMAKKKAQKATASKGTV